MQACLSLDQFLSVEYHVQGNKDALYYHFEAQSNDWAVATETAKRFSLEYAY